MHWETLDTITLDGRTFRVESTRDDTMGPPWEEHEGHGNLREIRRRDEKRAGEVIILTHRGDRWAYDWAGAMRTAKREGWRINRDRIDCLARKLGRAPRPGEIRAEAVRCDLEFCRDWLNDEWQWIGVSVHLLGPDGESLETADLWGIASFGDYWREVARELAGNILQERGRLWRGALREARERVHWIARGVVTTGTRGDLRVFL